MLLIYFVTFILCVALSVGVGMLITVNLKEDIPLMLTFLSQSLVLGTLIFVVAFGFVAFAAMLVINFIFVDKPFKFWDKNEEVKLGEDIHADAEIDISSNIIFSLDAIALALELSYFLI